MEKRGTWIMRLIEKKRNIDNEINQSDMKNKKHTSKGY